MIHGIDYSKFLTPTIHRGYFYLLNNLKKTAVMGQKFHSHIYWLKLKVD